MGCGKGILFDPELVPSLRISRQGGRWWADPNGVREPICLECARATNAVLRHRGKPEMVVVPWAYYWPDPSEAAEKLGRKLVRELMTPPIRALLQFAAKLVGPSRWRAAVEAVVRQHPDVQAKLTALSGNGLDADHVLAGIFAEVHDAATAPCQPGGELTPLDTGSNGGQLSARLPTGAQRCRRLAHRGTQGQAAGIRAVAQCAQANPNQHSED